jgi:hypothetical protein
MLGSCRFTTPWVQDSGFPKSTFNSQYEVLKKYTDSTHKPFIAAQ